MLGGSNKLDSFIFMIAVARAQLTYDTTFFLTVNLPVLVAALNTDACSSGLFDGYTGVKDGFPANLCLGN